MVLSIILSIIASYLFIGKIKLVYLFNFNFNIIIIYYFCITYLIL